MGNILRGIIYTGLAAAVGVVGYIAGKSKHWKGISLTTMGLALILYTPRGCEMLEKYAVIRGEVTKARIYGYARKDSLDAVLKREESRDSSRSYFINALQEVSSLERNLTDSYNQLVSDTEDRYKGIISSNTSGYEEILSDMKKQNAALLKRIDVMNELQGQANAVAASVASGNVGKGVDTGKEIIVDEIAPNSYAAKTEDTLTWSEKMLMARKNNVGLLYPPNASPEQIKAVDRERDKARQKNFEQYEMRERAAMQERARILRYWNSQNGRQNTNNRQNNY